MRHVAEVFWSIVTGVMILGGLIVGIPLAWGLPVAGLTWLAGGHEEGFGFIFLFWPFALAITLLALIVDNAIYTTERSGLRRRPSKMTIAWIAFYLLPIILNSLSWSCHFLDWKRVETLLFQWRWAAQPAIFSGIIVLLILGIVTRAGWRWLKTLLKINQRPL